MKSAIRAAAGAWHRAIASTPAASAYLSGLSAVARRLPHGLGIRAYNSVRSVDGLRRLNGFRPRRVVVGSGTEILLTPHLGEFDGQALFTRRLEYERPVFEWLEREASAYDVVIEIGANVGVFTVALAKLSAGRIEAFEPSPEASRRLRQNLAVNGASRVTVHQAAVSDRGGSVTFYEPADHLANGSVLSDFAGKFAPEVRATSVRSVDAKDLLGLVRDGERLLFKIDVEGHEPTVLRALSPVIERHRPDILVEVLQGTPEALAGIPWLLGYETLLLGPSGPELRPLRAHAEHRDWLFRPK